MFIQRTFVSLALLLVIKVVYAQAGFTDLVTKTEKSVVMVRTYDTKGTPLKDGTAFFIDKAGILLSNFHVFEGANTAKITTSDNRQYQVEKILSSSKEYDLIKFSISNSLNEHFPILDIAINTPGKGEDIFVIGTPEGFGSSVSKGIVSGIRQIEGMGNIFQITAPISAGSSGSPVLNMQGQVFAIASYQYQSGQNLNFAIDLKLVNKLKSNEAFNSSIGIDKELPNDRAEATKIIDAAQFPSKENLNFINEYISKFPNDYFGYLKRAEVYTAFLYRPEGSTNDNIRQKKTEALILADRDYTKALELSSNKNLILYHRGISKYCYSDYQDPLLKDWNLNGALVDFNNCSGFDKGINSYYSKYEYIGDIKNDMKKYQEAINAYMQAIISYPERPKIYVLFGKCASIYYNYLHDFNKASIYIDKALANADMSKPNMLEGFHEWNLFVLRANIRFDLNDLSGALADINIVLTNCECTEKSNPWNHYLKAYLIFRMGGDLNNSVSSLNTALEYAKDDKTKASIYNFRSDIYYLLANYQMAIIDKNRYFELTPVLEYNAIDYSSRSDIKKSLNDNIGALKDINKAIELDCKKDTFYYSKGVILDALNDEIAAIIAFDKAIEINPKEAGYYKIRGFAKYENNKTGACADWSKAGEMGDYSAYDLIKLYCK